MRYALCIALGLVGAYQYIQTIGVQCENFCAEMHYGILNATIAAPYRYRLLAAWLVEPLRVLSGDVTIAYGLAHVIVLPLMLVCLYRWLREWAPETAALVGVTLSAAYLPLMLDVWGIALYTPLEIVFLCLGLLLMAHQPRGWMVGLAVITVIATLNRETALLLPLVYLAFPNRRWSMRVLLLLCWALPFAGVRILQGAAPDALTIIETWQANTGGGWFTIAALMKHSLFLPLWLGYTQRYRGAPLLLKRLLFPALVYVALVVVFALWHEVRLLLPLLVFTLPVIVSKGQPDA